MATVTPTTAAQQIDKLWSAELNTAVEYDTVIFGLLDDRSSELPHGDTLYLPSSHNLTANTKTPGSDLTPEAITETKQTFQVATHQAICQQIDDITEIQTKYDLRAQTTQRGSYSLARAADVNAAAVIDDNSTQTVGNIGSELTVDNLILARKYLKDAAAPLPYVGVVSPGTYSGFLKVDMFTNMLYNGDDTGKAVHMAQVGKLFGAMFYESQLLTGTAPNSSGCVWSKTHYFKIVQRTPTTHTWYSPLGIGWIVVMDQLYDTFEREEAVEGAAGTTTAKLWSVRLQSYK